MSATLERLGLDAALETLIKTGNVDVDDPVNPGWWYALNLDPPMLVHRGPVGQEAGICVRWQDVDLMSANREYVVIENFSSIIAAILSRAPVFALQDGQEIRDLYADDESVVMERHEAQVTLSEGEVARLLEVPLMEVEPPRGDAVWDAGTGVLTLRVDGSEWSVRLSSIEFR